MKVNTQDFGPLVVSFETFVFTKDKIRFTDLLEFLEVRSLTESYTMKKVRATFKKLYWKTPINLLVTFSTHVCDLKGFQKW